MSIVSVMPSNLLIHWCPLLLASVFPSIRVFAVSWLFTSGGQSIGTLASASVLPMNIQGQFPLGLIGLISLLFKHLLRVFSSTTDQKHQFFSAQLSSQSNSKFCPTEAETLAQRELGGQVGLKTSKLFLSPVWSQWGRNSWVLNLQGDPTSPS